MSKSISLASPWYLKLLDEIKRWDANYIDVEILLRKAQSAEEYRNKLVILERKLEMINEEKNIFTSIERRLQEKCAELQHELNVMRRNENVSIENRPVALPRQSVSVNVSKTKKNVSEDEGISSSETSSPVPVGSSEDKTLNRELNDDCNASIDDVIEELTNIVHEEEREIIEKENNGTVIFDAETEIVANLLPKPPKKLTLSVVNILSQNYVDSDYDLHFVNNDQNLHQFDLKQQPDIINTIRKNHWDGDRQHIMKVKQNKEDDTNLKSLSLDHELSKQTFNGGIFLMDYPSHSTTSLIGQNQPTTVCITDVKIKDLKNSNQSISRQIFLPPSHITKPHNVAFNNFKFKNTNVNPALFDHIASKEIRTQSNNGFKVTDLISGLY